jgi:hypothetical protein
MHQESVKMHLLSDDYDYRILFKPGFTLSENDQLVLRDELCALGSLSIRPLPDYQVFSTKESCLDDKLIVAAYTKTKNARQLVAFTSAVLLDIGQPENRDTIVHCGLTVVHPQHRGRNLVIHLFAHLFMDVVTRWDGPVWLSNLSARSDLLGLFHTFVQDVYPAPNQERPTSQHVEIANAIDTSHRNQMLISATALFDGDRFVFQGSNSDAQAEGFLHKARPVSSSSGSVVNVYYAYLIHSDRDEVLQVGFLDKASLMARASKVIEPSVVQLVCSAAVFFQIA